MRRRRRKRRRRRRWRALSVLLVDMLVCMRASIHTLGAVSLTFAHVDGAVRCGAVRACMLACYMHAHIHMHAYSHTHMEIPTHAHMHVHVCRHAYTLCGSCICICLFSRRPRSMRTTRSWPEGRRLLAPSSPGWRRLTAAATSCLSPGHACCDKC